MKLVYYLSHPQVRIDPVVAVPDWGLSDVGRARLDAIAGQQWLGQIERIVSSEERKAIESAEILGRQIGVAVETRLDMHENDRSATGYLPPEEFEATADAFFARPADSVRGWERACDAQARIVDAVRVVLRERDVTTLFVGHGGVGTLLRCAVCGDPIDRRYDQVAGGGASGGGNVHAFLRDPWMSVFDWTAIEALA